MKNTAIIASAAVLVLAGCSSSSTSKYLGIMYSATSPDGRNEIRLYSSPLAYDVVRDGVLVVHRTEIGLRMNGKCIKEGGAKPCAVRPATLSGFAPSPVYKKGKVDLSGKELFVDFGDWGVRLAARNDGVAYRFETKKPGIVDCEKADITIPKSARCWYNRTGRASLGCEETMPEFADASALKTDFLGAGTWKAEIFRDAGDADENPMKYIHETKTVKAGEELSFHMASGGGFVVRFTKVERLNS